MTLDPRLLRPFVVVAEELHFGRAAERLHITQPALSQQIARLERQVGIRLLDRTQHRVELSNAGRAVLEPGREAVRAADAAAAAAWAHATGQAGTLRLGFSPGAHHVAQAVLADLRDETFALVDAHDGSGYNAAVRAQCRAAGFEPRTPPNPHGPLAWETAVRTDGCVGLTTHASAPATARGVRRLRLQPPITFPIHLITGHQLSPAAREFAAIALSSS